MGDLTPRFTRGSICWLQWHGYLCVPTREETQKFADPLPRAEAVECKVLKFPVIGEERRAWLHGRARRGA
jgi:hypothetical protein